MHYINYIMIFAYIHRLDFTIEDNEFLPVAGLGNNGLHTCLYISRCICDLMMCTYTGTVLE